MLGFLTSKFLPTIHRSTKAILTEQNSYLLQALSNSRKILAGNNLQHWKAGLWCELQVVIYDGPWTRRRTLVQINTWDVPPSILPKAVNDLTFTGIGPSAWTNTLQISCLSYYAYSMVFGVPVTCHVWLCSAAPWLSLLDGENETRSLSRK